MTKNELLERLESIRRTEESVGIYVRHVQNTLYLSGLKKDICERIDATLGTIDRENLEYNRLLKQLLEESQKGDRNVY